MRDCIRSLLIGIVLLIVTVIYIVMKSYGVGIFTGVLSVVWFGKAIAEWRADKE